MTANSQLVLFAIQAGRRLYVAGRGSNTVSVVDCRTNTLLSTLSVGDEPVALAWDEIQSRLYVANHASSEVTVILDTALAAVAETRGPKPDPADRFLLAGTGAHLPGRTQAGLFDETGRLAQRLEPGDNDVRSLTPGVYFIVPHVSAPGRPRKLLITR